MPSLKILLPVDITESHADLCSILNNVLPLKDVEIKLLYVREELPSIEHILATMGDFPEDLMHQIDDTAKEVLESIKSELSAICPHISSVLASGPIASTIESVAKDQKSDLIVLPPGTHSRVEQLLLGSTSSHVVRHALQTVLILRDTEQNQQVKNVVIGVDGSAQSENALRTAVRQFKLGERGATVHVINVVAIRGVWKYVSQTAFVAAIEDNLTMAGEAIIAGAEKILAEEGVKKIELTLKSGNPAVEINKLVAAKKADLVVVAAHDKAVENFLLGSVSEQVALHSPCSTLVVREKSK